MRRLLIGIAMLSSVATAQTPPPTGHNPEIVVEGRKLDSRDIAAAVRSISSPEPIGGFDAQYPRWKDQICVMVAGFRQDGGEYIADRIGEVARNLELDPGLPGCTPNIFIIASDDPAKLMATLVYKRTGLITGKDTAIVRRIQESHDAVRWIGATTIKGGFGESGISSSFGLAGRSTPQFNSYNGGSRLTANTRAMLTRETVIVDARKIDGISVGQLADYLAFVSLAQLSPGASPSGVDSILSLFSSHGGSAPVGLTAFDKAYLAGLYQSQANAVGTIQKDSIEATIDRTLASRTALTSKKIAPNGP